MDSFFGDNTKKVNQGSMKEMDKKALLKKN